MKKSLLLIASLALCCSSVFARQYKEACDLTLVGKLFPDTPNPYHRVDTVVYKGFTKGENKQVRQSSGIAVAFRTNSKFISVKTNFKYASRGSNTNAFASRGYDLYIKDNGVWRWAGSGEGKDTNKEITLVKNMASGEKECLMYLPIYSEENSIQVGVADEAFLEPLENPFHHRICVFGSSYTQGSCTSRSGMAWPSQFSRMTGLQMLNLGCSGNSKLQSYFADCIKCADVDAYVFDAFSNPSAELIEERLFPFIENIQAAKPGVPLIFLSTIHREKRNFDLKIDKYGKDKMEMAEKMMEEAVKKYKDVYFVTETATATIDGAFYEPTVDGTHPDNYGYYLWAKSIVEPVTKILKNYGIK